MMQLMRQMLQPQVEDSYEALLALDEHNVVVGLKSDQISRLTTLQTLRTADDLKRITQSHETCPICLDEYELNQKIRRLPCMCVFHQECIEKHFETSKVCPTCRAEIAA